MKQLRSSNARFARSIATTDPTAASWDALDALPADVRHALWEVPVSINPVQIRDLVFEFGEPATLAMIQSAVANELDLFARDYARRSGRVLPHVAADVSLQPY